MSYGTKYILGFTNDLNELYEIYFDFLDYSGQITQLTGAEKVLTLRCTSGDENKLASILGTEALIDIFVDETTPIDISDLIAEHDNDIRVTVYRDEDYTTNVFQGFIVVEDNSQAFADPPYMLSVRALDGLGLLKGVDLVDLNGLLFAGNFSILNWIMQILYKTDQTLNLRAYFNIFHSSFSQFTGALEQAYLHSITFSQGDAFNNSPTDPTIDIAATAADDCYTALEKIVRCLRCRLFQENGVWNLVSLYEYLNPAGMSYREYAFGDISGGMVVVNSIASASELDMSAAVGRDQTIYPIAEDQNIYLKVATKWIKLTYTYDQSANKVCNQDFAEGDRNATYDETISSSILDPSITPVVNLSTLGYDAYCWDHFNGTTNVGTGVQNPYPQFPPDSNAFIRSVIDQLGYEKERYLVIKNSASGKPTYMLSSQFLIDTNDALVINMTTRSRSGHGTGLFIDFAFVLLTGDDGSFWALNGIEGPGVVSGGIAEQEANKATWISVNSSFQNSFGNTPAIGWRDTTQAFNTWFSVASGQYKPSQAPVSGTVRIYLVNWVADETWHKNLTVQMTPYLQGSYTQLKGDYNYSAKNTNIKQTRSDTVEISDSPKRYFKGALLKANQDVLSPQWTRAGFADNARFTQLMERIMYIHLSRMVNKIEGTFKGLVYVPVDNPYIVRPNGFLNSYYFTEAAEPTKRFMLTSFEKDYATGQSRSVFVEVLKDQNDNGWAAPDAYQFSYIFQS